jgi:hypothetical protein
VAAPAWLPAAVQLRLEQAFGERQISQTSASMLWPAQSPPGLTRKGCRFMQGDAAQWKKVAKRSGEDHFD